MFLESQLAMGADNVSKFVIQQFYFQEVKKLIRGKKVYEQGFQHSLMILLLFLLV